MEFLKQLAGKEDIGETLHTIALIGAELLDSGSLRWVQLHVQYMCNTCASVCEATCIHVLWMDCVCVCALSEVWGCVYPCNWLNVGARSTQTLVIMTTWWVLWTAGWTLYLAQELITLDPQRCFQSIVCSHSLLQSLPLSKGEWFRESINKSFLWNALPCSLYRSCCSDCSIHTSRLSNVS